jgi:pyruvate ferredoxin oxidoreductase delta subunit
LKEKVIKLELVPGGWISEPIEAKKTGTWRTHRPIVNLEKCVACGICTMYCPEACIEIVDKHAKIDYEYCKGCGVCANECPLKAIQMISEIQARSHKNE